MSAAAKRTALAAVSVVLLVAVSIAGPAGGASSGKRDRVPPTAPTDIHVTAATPSLVFTAWTPSQDDVGVAGYYVYGDTGRATVASPAYVVSSLACGESTSVAVVAFDHAGNRSPRATTTVSAAACPDVQPPSTPSGFRQAATTQDAVVLEWNPSSDNVGVVGYGVYRNLVRVGSPSEPTVTLSGLACGSTYAYAVDAVDAAGNRSLLGSAYLQTASCSDGQPPSAPTNLTVTSRTATSIALSWSASNDDVGVAGYRLSSAGTVTTVSQPAATLSGLACSTNYSIGVYAFDAAGNTSPVTSITAATDGCPPPPPSSDTTPPSTPTGLAASNISQTSLNLTWNASSDNVGVTGYDVSRNATKIDSVGSTSSSQTNLSCGTSYDFSVVARDAAGNSSQPAQLTVATSACSAPPPPPSADTTPPAQPTNLGISSVTPTSVTLTWSPSTDNVGVAGYRTYVNGAAVSTSAQPGATVSNLTCGTAYTFEVDAYDAAGNRSTRASLVGSTAACVDSQPPTTPANVVASSRTSTSIALSWSASSDNVGVTGYGLYRGGALVGTSGTTTGVFSGLTCNTNYTLSVDSYDAAGNRSGQTTLMVATTACPDTTPPTMPSSLAVSAIALTSLTLTWAASADNVGVAGYDVYRNNTKVASVTAISSSQTDLVCGTSYSFGVEAYDAAGNRSQRAQLSASTAACSVSPPPTSPPYFVGDFDTCNLSQWTDFHDAQLSMTPPGFVAQSTPRFGSGCSTLVTVTNAADTSTSGDGSVLWEGNGSNSYGLPYLQNGADTWFRMQFALPDGQDPSFPGKFTVAPLGGWDIIEEWHAAPGAGYSTVLNVHPSWGYPGSPGVLMLRPVGGSDPNNQTFTNLYQTNGAAQTEANRIPIRFNHWYDVVVHLVFGTTSATGRVEWWIDGVAQTSANVPTITQVGSSVPGVGHEVGLYRGPSRTDTDTIYIDGVRAGPMRSSVGF